MKWLTTLFVSLVLTTLTPLNAMHAEVSLMDKVRAVFNQHKPGLHESDALEKDTKLHDALEAIRNNSPLDETGITPLEAAVQEKKREWLEFILFDARKKYITTYFNNDPTGVYVLKRSDTIKRINRFREAVIDAIREKKTLRKMSSETLEAGVNQPLDGSGNTALHLATVAQSHNLITYLLSMGATLKKNISEKSPLDLARDLENSELIALFEPMN